MQKFDIGDKVSWKDGISYGTGTVTSTFGGNHWIMVLIETDSHEISAVGDELPFALGEITLLNKPECKRQQ